MRCCGGALRSQSSRTRAIAADPRRQPTLDPKRLNPKASIQKADSGGRKIARTRALSVTERACVGFCNNPAAEGDEWGEVRPRIRTARLPIGRSNGIRSMSQSAKKQ